MEDFRQKVVRIGAVFISVAILICLFASTGRTQDSNRDEEGLSYAPFSVDKQEKASVTVPDSIHFGNEPPPLEFCHFISFDKSQTPCEIRSPLVKFGEEGKDYNVNINGRMILLAAGRVELALYNNNDIKIGARIFSKEVDTPFSYPLTLWGGEEYRIALKVFAGSSGKLCNLQVDYPPTINPDNPVFLSYYSSPPLPPSVIEKNSFRYLEVSGRDKALLSGLIYIAAGYLLLVLLFAFLTKYLFKKSRLKAKGSKSYKIMRLGSLVSLVICGMLIIIVVVELVFRMAVCFANDDPVLMTYPFGFNQTDITRLYYERDNSYRFDTKMGGDIVAHITHGNERNYYKNYYYKAHVNQGGYRGELKPLKKNAKRVFCIGGSSTYGLNKDGRTFPDYIQAALDQESQEEHVVFNLGVPALDSSKYLGRLKHVFNVKPDYIVIYAGFNDIGIQAGDIFAHKQNIARNHFLYGIAHYSLVCRNLLVTLLQMSATDQAADMGQFLRGSDVIFSVVMSKSRAYAERIDKVLSYALEVGAKVLYLDEYAYIGTEASLQYGRDLLEKAREGGWIDKPSNIPMYSKALLTLAMEQLHVRKLIAEKGYSHVHCFSPDCFESKEIAEILNDWVHLTAEGNRILGEFIAKKLILIQEDYKALHNGGSHSPEQNLLKGEDFELTGSAKIKQDGDSFLIQNSKWKKVALSMTPQVSVSKLESGYLTVSMCIQVNHPMIHLAPMLIRGEKELPLADHGVYLSKGEKAYTWTVDLCGIKGKEPVKIELSFKGLSDKTSIIVKDIDAYLN